MQDLLKFHHVGYAVWDIESSKRTYSALGFQCSETADDQVQGVYLASCYKQSEPLMELVAPATDDSPCSQYLAKNGPGPYHVCYQCDDIENVLKAMTEQKVRFKKISSAPVESVLFQGYEYFFVWAFDLGLTEFLQKVGSADVLNDAASVGN